MITLAENEKYLFFRHKQHLNTKVMVKIMGDIKCFFIKRVCIGRMSEVTLTGFSSFIVKYVVTAEYLSATFII